MYVYIYLLCNCNDIVDMYVALAFGSTCNIGAWQSVFLEYCENF